MDEHDEQVFQEIKRNLEKNKIVSMVEHNHEPMSLRVSKVKDKRMQLTIKLVVWTIALEVISTIFDVWANHSDLAGPISFLGGASTIFGLLSLIAITLALGQLFRARTGFIKKEIRENELL